MRRLAIPAPKAAEAHLPLMTFKIVNEINIFIEGSFHYWLSNLSICQLAIILSEHVTMKEHLQKIIIALLVY